MSHFAAPIAEQIWDMKYRFKQAPMIPIYIYTSKHLMNSSVKNHNGNLLDQTTFKELTLESDSSDSTGGNH